MRRQGTTTVEIKSGYGLTVRDEARSLAVARQFTDETTFLGAHVVPEGTDAGGVRRPGHRPDARGRARRTPAGSTCSASAAPSTPTRPARCSRPARGAGLRGRLHANQLGPGPGVRLAAELGLVAVDHCTYLDDADVAALRRLAARSPPCCRASSSRPASPTPTRGGCSTPASGSRSPATATRAPASPPRCRCASPSRSARWG